MFSIKKRVFGAKMNFFLQREQEYAEARKRILGEEKSPEEKIVQEVSKIQPKPSVSGKYINK